MSRTLNRVALLGTYVPRRCGIATFTSDLAGALAQADPEIQVDAIAMSDRAGYLYPRRARREILDWDVDAYRAAADFINRGAYDILSLQHEYGIFGGEAGCYVLNLLREVKMPIVTTLHTVLRDPLPEQKRVMDEILQLSERVVVMSNRAVQFLDEVHGLESGKVDWIPHGIPEKPDGAGKALRAKLCIDGPMILTFGLLSPDKGIEFVIEAMPEIVDRHPGATYVILGATHPNVRASCGEAYRDSLVETVHKLGVENNVRFVDRFVDNEELVEFLAATDIYVTPYLNPNQITSGTLAYAVGAGKAVISTPYWYAEELLGEGRGVLVPSRDAGAISSAVQAIQSDPAARAEMKRRASEYGRQMMWSQVGSRYLQTFAQATTESAEGLWSLLPASAGSKARPEAPALNLDHIRALSDDTGIMQHAIYSAPNRSEGYCLDDNARALILCSELSAGGRLTPEFALLQSRYLSFVLHAFNEKTDRFRNFMSYGREWLEESGSEDSHGRALWALAAVVNRSGVAGYQSAAKAFFGRALPAIADTTSPRTWAFGVLAADEYLRAIPLDVPVWAMRENMADRLMRLFDKNRSPDWPWFEQSLTYGNARLPQALILAGRAMGRPRMSAAGLESLAWLMKCQTGVAGVFAPVGTNGFYIRGERPAEFDQQPLEAWDSMSACLSAARATGRSFWFAEARRAFNWFLGENALGLPLYDAATGGCRDGLHRNCANENEGAESTLSFLCALLEFSRAQTARAFPVGKVEAI